MPTGKAVVATMKTAARNMTLLSGRILNIGSFLSRGNSLAPVERHGAVRIDCIDVCGAAAPD
jgi:hypothetical protein